MQEEDSDRPSLKAPRLSSSVTGSRQGATWPGFLQGEGEVGEGRKGKGDSASDAERPGLGGAAARPAEQHNTE